MTVSEWRGATTRRQGWAQVGVALALLAAAVACPRLLVPVTGQEICTQDRRVDVASVAAPAKVDILLVVDTRASAAGVLAVADERLSALFSIITATQAPPDFHLAVAPTNLRGQLLPVPPSVVDPRAACLGQTDLGNLPVIPDAGMLTPDGGIFDIRPAECPDCPRYLSRSLCQCDLGVNGNIPPCRNLQGDTRRLMRAVTANPAGFLSSLGPVQTARSALGLLPACGESAARVDPPVQNAGFYRHDAALVLLFLMADEDPVFGLAGNAELYQALLRQLRSLKGPGREDQVTVITITGLCSNAMRCTGAGAVVSPTSFCEGLRDMASPPACGPSSVLQVNSPISMGNQVDPCDQCPDGSLVCPGQRIRISAAPQMMALACDTGGVVYNICAPDWTSVFTGDIERKLNPAEFRVRLDQIPQPAQVSTACPAGPGVCVELETPQGQLIQLGDRAGAVAFDPDDNQKLIIRERSLHAGAQLRVTYDVAPGTARCCEAGCEDAEFCNNPVPGQGYCQGVRCNETLACPPGAGSCDVLTGRCIGLDRCVRDEQCPFGYACDCAQEKCVSVAGACTQ